MLRISDCSFSREESKTFRSVYEWLMNCLDLFLFILLLKTVLSLQRFVKLSLKMRFFLISFFLWCLSILFLNCLIDLFSLQLQALNLKRLWVNEALTHLPLNSARSNRNLFVQLHPCLKHSWPICHPPCVQVSTFDGWLKLRSMWDDLFLFMLTMICCLNVWVHLEF